MADLKPSEAAAEAFGRYRGYLAAVPGDGDPRTIAERLDALAELEAACRHIDDEKEHFPLISEFCNMDGHPWPCPIECIRCLLPEADRG